MYTDERPRRGNLLKEFVLKLILIIIFVLLLIWLVPWPNMDAYLDALNPLKDQIFNANLQTMKEAGITYFTSERLPENIGDKKTLTLQQMLDMKLLIPFTDRNGNSCDVSKSYVSLEKQETEYLMKVNLKCGEEEDYILVHLGCYSYCTKDICEAKPESTEKPSTKPIKDNVKPTPTPTPTSTPTYVPRYQCRKVNGEYWGKNWTVVNYSTYVQQCTTPTPTPPTPTPVPDKHYCEFYNGQYYGKDGDIVSKEVYDIECPGTDVRYYCKVVDGQYWGRNGIIVDYNTFIIECTDAIEYEYKKETREYHEAEYSKWSEWTIKTAGVNEVIKNITTPTKEVRDLGIVTEQQQVKRTYAVTKQVQEQVGEHTYTVCRHFEYVGDGEIVYEIKSDWRDVPGSEYRGYNPPADTISSRWVFIGIDFSKCGSDCVNHPYVIYKQQVRDVVAHKVYKNITANCTDVVEKSIPLYITRTKVLPETVTEYKEISVHKYKERTRKLLKEAYEDYKVDYKWSYKDDYSLLNAGYVYTGKTRVVK